MNPRRRCVTCCGFPSDHQPGRLEERGFRWHPYDPGERRSAEPEPRAVVWSDKRRAKHGRAA